MRVPTRRIALLLALLSLLLVGSVAPTFASTPPQPVCTACGESFEKHAAYEDLDLTVDHSVATVEIHDDGSATWTVENRVDESAAARFRDDPSLLDTVAADAVWSTDAVDATVAAERPVVTLRWTEGEYAKRTLGGALVVTEFHNDWAGVIHDELGADRLTVVAPESMRVRQAVDGATVEGEESRRMVLTEYEHDDGVLVTFAPRAALPQPIPTAIAVAHLTAPVFAGNLLLFVGLPGALFLGGFWLVSAAVDRVRPSEWLSRVRSGLGPSPVALLTTAVGLCYLAYSVLAELAPSVLGGGPSILGVPPSPEVGAGLTVFGGWLVVLTAREVTSYRTLVAGVALSAVATAGSAVALNGGSLARSVDFQALLLLAAVSLVPAGYALGRGRRRLAVLTAFGGFLLPIVVPISLTTPLDRFTFLVVLSAVVYGASFPVLASPLLAAGTSLAGWRTTEAEPTRHAD